MEFNDSNKNIKWVKYGLIWNAVTLLLASLGRGSVIYNNGGSFTLALGGFLFLLIVGGIVLFFNIYAYRLVLKLQTIQAVHMAIAMAVAGLLSLNIVGSLAILLCYLRIRKELKLLEDN